MAKQKKSTQKIVQTPAPSAVPPTPSIPVTPEIQDLMTQLVEKCTSLVYDLVDCDCSRRKDCQVFNTARDIARVLRGLTKVVPKAVPRETRPANIA